MKWSEIVAESQRRILKSDDKNIRIERNENLNAGTSDLIVIQDVDKQFYFKKEEKAIAATPEAVIHQLAEEYKEEMEQLLLGDKGAYSYVPEESRKQRLESLATMVKCLDLMSPALMELEVNKSLFGSSDVIWNTHSDLTKDLNEGFKAAFKEAFDQVHKDFSKRGRNAAMCQTARIDPGSEITKRDEATSIMADLLGISDMVMVSKRANLDMDGEQVSGLRMDTFYGKSSSESLSTPNVIGKTTHMSTRALKQLMTLQVYDIICGQVDRNETNYLVKTEFEGDQAIVQNICAIDNDFSFGKLTYNDILTKATNIKGGQNTTETKNIENGDEILLKGLDTTVAEKILALTPSMIDVALSGLLSKDELYTCKDRLKGVQQAILKMKKQDEEHIGDLLYDPYLKESETDWNILLHQLEREANEDINAEKQIVQNSYIKSYVLGKKMDSFANFGEWLKYTAKCKETFFKSISWLTDKASKYDYNGMASTLANVNGAWITINSDFSRLIPKLKKAIDNHDDMVIAETLYELDQIRMRQAH
ncbi:MAG: hypothetical protein K6B14_04560 [Lachnospiraceae bacterium]|nr:hypothetical protein [Lachnospiraceae bacterium]